MKRTHEFPVGISTSRSCPSIKARKIERNTFLEASELKTMIEAKYIKIHPNARDRVKPLDESGLRVGGDVNSVIRSTKIMYQLVPFKDSDKRSNS